MLSAMETQTEVAPAEPSAPRTQNPNPVASTLQAAIKSAIVQCFRSNPDCTLEEVIDGLKKADGIDHDIIDEVLATVPIGELLHAPAAENGHAKNAKAKRRHRKKAPPKAVAVATLTLEPADEDAIVQYVNKWDAGTAIKTAEIVEATGLGAHAVIDFMKGLETVEAHRKGRGYFWTVN